MHGHAGDSKTVGKEVSEMRIDYGPGYRVYFIQHKSIIIVLLCGGDKSTQTADIKKAQKLAKQWKDEHNSAITIPPIIYTMKTISRNI